MDIQQEIQNRIEQLTVEGNQAVSTAAKQAAVPYEAAIGELRRLLELIAQNTQNNES